MTNLPALNPSDREARIAAIRDIALDDLEGFIQETVDKVRADGKASDYIAMLAQLTKLSGAEAEKKDPYAGLKMVNIVIGSNMSVSAAIEPPKPVELLDTLPGDVIDVKPKVEDEPDIDPDAPDDIPRSELTAAFEMLGSSLVLPDD